MTQPFIPPEGAMQIAVRVDWNDMHIPCEEYPVWVMPLAERCPHGKRGFRVIDPQYMDGSGRACECFARVIE